MQPTIILEGDETGVFHVGSLTSVQAPTASTSVEPVIAIDLDESDDNVVGPSQSSTESTFRTPRKGKALKRKQPPAAAGSSKTATRGSSNTAVRYVDIQNDDVDINMADQYYPAFLSNAPPN